MPTKISIMLLQLGSSENTLSTNILLIAKKTPKIQQNQTKQNKQTKKTCIQLHTNGRVNGGKSPERRKQTI